MSDYVLQNEYYPQDYWAEIFEYWPQAPTQTVIDLVPENRTYFWINIEDINGNVIGDGPIIDAQQFRVVRRLDKAGEISFTLPASSGRASYIVSKRIARCYTILNNQVVEFGAGIIDKIDYQIDSYGVLNMEVSGDDLLRELTYRTVGFLQVDETVSGKIGLQSVGTFFPTGWSFDTVNGYDSTQETIYASFAGETALNCLNKITEKLGEHFRLGTGRNVVWLRKDQPDSGLRAIRNLVNPLEVETETDICLISDIQETRDTYELFTRIYPFGSGNGEDRLDLFWSTLTLPAGWTIDRTFNWIQNDSAVTEFGLIEKYVSFKDIGPISNSDIDLENASNYLLYAAYEELRKSVQINRNYSLNVQKLDAIVYPGQTIKVEYTDWIEQIKILEIDENLFILETTSEIDQFGVRTTDLSVSTIDRWPKTDYDLITGQLSESRVFEAHPQFSVGYFSENFGQFNMDSAESATNFASMTFKFGNEIVKLNNAKLRFKTDVFEATTKNASTSDSTSTSTDSADLEIESTDEGGGGTRTSRDGGGDTRSSTSGGSHSHSIPVFAGDADLSLEIRWDADNNRIHAPDVLEGVDEGFTSNSEDAHSHEIEIPEHQHEIDLPEHSHDVNIPGHSHDVTISGHTHTLTYGLQRNIGEYPGPLSLTINGDTYPLTSGQVGSSTESTGEVEIDITDYINENLRQVHTLVFVASGGKGRITAALRCFVTVQAIILT